MGRKKGYNQFCPVAKGAEIFAERWTPLILRELLAGTRRFNDIRKGLPRISQSLLSLRLRELVDAALIQRRQAKNGIGWEYVLTEAGQELGPHRNKRFDEKRVAEQRQQGPRVRQRIEAIRRMLCLNPGIP